MNYLSIVAGELREDFDEGKHPREEDGKFAAKGGGSNRGSSLFPWQNMSDDDLDAAEAEMERQEQEEFAKEDKLAKRRDSAITPRGQYELCRRLGLTYDSTLEYAGNPRNALIRELRKDFARAWSE